MPLRHIRDHYLPPDADAYRRAEPVTGRLIVIAPTRAACETIELALHLAIETVLEREHGDEIREYARQGVGVGIVAGTGTGKTMAIRSIAREMLQAELQVGVVNREREATPETPSWNVVIVTTGIARRWFQGDLIDARDTLVVDEIHQTSAELELSLALGKRVGCRFIWLSATVDPAFYANYLESAHVLETSAFDPALAADVEIHVRKPMDFLDHRFMKAVLEQKRGVAVFLPTRAEVEEVAEVVSRRWKRVDTAFYHGGEPIKTIRPFLEGTAKKPFVLAMTAAGQSALNIRGLDTVVIYDARYGNIIQGGRNVLTRQYLGANEILQMAGRVHGRVAGGQVHILTNRDIDFASLVPTPPEFQLAGDSERVALTAAALGVDLLELDLPVPLDRIAYRRAVETLTDRGIVKDRRLTDYGRYVEAMPVDRPWGEMLVRMEDALTPFVAVAANVESLHRMTREVSDLRGLTLERSDHLTAYNLYAEAVNDHGYIGKVFGLARHQFHETLADWADSRGVMVKAIEDLALGTASVYRTLELPLPESMPTADRKVLRRFRELLAEVMSLDLVIDEQTADGEPVRVSRGSVASSWGAVAGELRYFADRRGNARGAIEGTNLPMDLIRRHARREPPAVEFVDRARVDSLQVVRRTAYCGFELDHTREPLSGVFPDPLADSARDTLVQALVRGATRHPNQAAVRRALHRMGEYWRRSGGQLAGVSPDRLKEQLALQLAEVRSVREFLETRIQLEVDGLVAAEVREPLDALPSSAPVRGDKAALDYEIENGKPVVRLRLREGQARRLRDQDLPVVDRPLRFTVVRGKHPAIRAESLDELRAKMDSLPAKRSGHKHKSYRRRRRR
jgi:hypothetical protein